LFDLPERRLRINRARQLAQASELRTTTSTYSLPAPLRVPGSKVSSFNTSPGREASRHDEARTGEGSARATQI
jgi:hypothetical protein